jgi:hypothetical protein
MALAVCDKRQCRTMNADEPVCLKRARGELAHHLGNGGRRALLREF